MASAALLTLVNNCKKSLMLKKLVISYFLKVAVQINFCKITKKIMQFVKMKFDVALKKHGRLIFFHLILR